MHRLRISSERTDMLSKQQKEVRLFVGLGLLSLPDWIRPTLEGRTSADLLGATL